MDASNSLTLETHSASESEALGIRLACALNGGMVITLSGELGAGKTVLVRGIACGLNMPAGVMVTSPTYVLQHIYRGGRLTLYHMDAYRLVGGVAELESSGLAECFQDEAGIVCVEWPERLADFQWPADRLEISIEHDEPQTRRFQIKAIGARAMVALKSLGIFES